MIGRYRGRVARLEGILRICLCIGERGRCACGTIVLALPAADRFCQMPSDEESDAGTQTSYDEDAIARELSMTPTPPASPVTTKNAHPAKRGGKIILKVTHASSSLVSNTKAPRSKGKSMQAKNAPKRLQQGNPQHVISSGVVHRLAKRVGIERISAGVPAFIDARSDELIAIVMRIATAMCNEAKKKTIVPAHILAALRMQRLNICCDAP